LALLVVRFSAEVSLFFTAILHTINASDETNDMRTFIVCQAYHMWNMQLIPKESLLDLLQLVISHDHFSQPLTAAEMLCCLPRCVFYFPFSAEDF
jgi:hypothetical protein